MSGQAGARVERELYSIFVGTGLNVCVHVPPGDDGSAVGNYFDATSAPYDRWLARAAPDLDLLIETVRAEGRLPLTALRQPCEQIDGTIIKDGEHDDTADARHFARYHRGGPLVLSINGPGLLPDLQTLNLALAVTGRVHRRDLDDLLARVAAVLHTHAADPPPEPEPPPLPKPPPEPPPTWLTRLRRWLAR